MSNRLDELLKGINHTPVEVASKGADAYAALMNQPRRSRFDNVVVNPVQKNMVAEDFMKSPDYDKEAEPNFNKMVEETKRQYDYMTKPTSKGGLGISMEVTKEDPYTKPSADGMRRIPDPEGMMRDVRENSRIKVFSTATTGEHPFFTNDENDMFRGVHDFFGHAATGRGFDESGEDAAYLSHASMFSPTARLAMATETRGQNMTNNSGIVPKNEDGSPGYAPNKIAIVPSTQLVLPWQGRRANFQKAFVQARLRHERAFGPIVDN
jgi:hypothetical protein